MARPKKPENEGLIFDSEHFRNVTYLMRDCGVEIIAGKDGRVHIGLESIPSLVAELLKIREAWDGVKT